MSERTLQDPSAPMKRAMFRALAIGAIAVILYISWLCLEIQIVISLAGNSTAFTTNTFGNIY